VAASRGRRHAGAGRLRQSLRDLAKKKLIWRRLAFVAEALDRVIPKRRGAFGDPGDSGEVRLEDAQVVVAITHWRYIGERPQRRAAVDNDDEVLLTCIRRLIAMPTAALHVIVLTNDRPATERIISEAILDDTDPLARAFRHQGRWEEVLGRKGPTVLVLQPRLRWPRHKGPYLTWAHKPFFRKALRDRRITHFVYLEDDIGLTEANFRYWIEARAVLEPSGFIPGFVLFEWREGERYLIQQTASGQHRVVLRSIEIPGWGALSMYQATLPYHASYIMDRALASEHFTQSAFRSPFRSRVAGWGKHERAASGPLFEASEAPLKNALRLGSAPYVPSARNAVPVQEVEVGVLQRRILDCALLEHLRPTYSTNPGSESGKLRVAEF